MSNIIIMNRGDTKTISFIPNTDTVAEYVLADNDTLYFGVMEPHQPFEKAIIKKKFVKADQDIDTKAITITLKNTDTLDLEPGIYYYAIKMATNQGLSTETVYTMQNKTKLVLND